MDEESTLKPAANLTVTRMGFLAPGILFFLFGVTLYVYGGGPIEFSFLDWSKTAPLWLSEILRILIQIPLLALIAIVSFSCLIGVFAPKTINKFLYFFDGHRRLKKYAAIAYFVLYFLAFTLNFFTSWIRNLGNTAQQEYLFFFLYGVGLIWAIAILRVSWDKSPQRPKTSSPSL